MPSLRATLPAPALALSWSLAGAQATPPDAAASAPEAAVQSVVIRASADASAQGLSPLYPGGQVARGGRAGILGTRDNMETPFSITAYTNELIQDRQAKSVGDVLQNDPTVRTARGFGNFQEAYFIRGFILGSDDVAYNGLYSLLPRQYIATELFERVEVLRGASAFLIGANPGGGGIGGAINLLPKRATNEPLTRVVLGLGTGGQGSAATDVSRRFGPDNATGVRVNLAYRGGDTAVDDEKASLGLASVGFDWRSRDVRLSADFGYQNNRLKETRPNVSLATATVPRVPDASGNFAQPWSYSNERDLFGTLRAEWDVAKDITAWAAYGLRRSEEANSLANPTVNDAATGAATTSRFDNTRKDQVDTGELGVRGKLRTGPVGHDWVATAAYFKQSINNAFAFDFTPLATNLYAPIDQPRPDFSATGTFFGGDLADPRLTNLTRMTSYAIGDTMSMLDDSVLLTLGLRRQTLDVSNYAYGTAVLTDRYDQSRNSPAVGVVFRGGKQWSLYANYIEGLSQGDTASGTPPPVNNGQMLAPYVSKQTEVGAKMDLGRLGGGVALFSTSKPRSLIDASNVFTSEGEDVHKGIELTAYGEAARGLRVLGGATWLDAKQKSTGSAATDGKRVIGVPETQANLGVEWEVAALSGLAVDGRVVYTGSSYADATNTLEVPGWTRLDIGARYVLDIGRTALTLRARIDNLFNRNYWASAGGFPGIGYLVVGMPRTLNLSASVDF